MFPSWPQYLSHRQLLAWQAWFEMEWNRPSRTDHYLMQLNYDVRYLFSKTRPRTLDPLKIPFRRADPEKPLTPEEATQRSRTAVIAASGGKFRVRLPDGSLVPGSKEMLR